MEFKRIFRTITIGQNSFVITDVITRIIMKGFDNSSHQRSKFSSPSSILFLCVLWKFATWSTLCLTVDADTSRPVPGPKDHLYLAQNVTLLLLKKPFLSYLPRMRMVSFSSNLLSPSLCKLFLDNNFIISSHFPWECCENSRNWNLCKLLYRKRTLEVWFLL